MYSEDDLYDSGGDDDDTVTSDYDGDDYDDYGSEDDDSDEQLQPKQKSYTVLNEEDISQRQKEDITELSSVLSITRESASILLLHYHWRVSNVIDAWFVDEEKVRKQVGLLEIPVFRIPDNELVRCGICFEFFSIDKMNAAAAVVAACGHFFCSCCWTGYISNSINDGPGCLMLQCPEPSCGVAVGEEMINLLVSEEDKKKYYRYLLRSYIEDNNKIKWCPAPGCDNAVDFVVGSGSYDVSCTCSYSFCWNCTEDAHRPVDCNTVGKWILKNCSEAENTTWILANSKQCPKCKRPIEKNQGCMHMTCSSPCKFEFCWLCLGDWTQHGEGSGGFYACNTYTKAKEEGLYDVEEAKREMAKNSLERYTHYYERWATNQSSRLKAAADLKKMQSVHMEKLSNIYKEPESQLKFITEAWQQIIECRRVLKWTYAYGYYLPEEEHTRRELFEYLQGEAESGLERLHQCVEKELQQYLDLSGKPKDITAFCAFRAKLLGLTSVTRNYFENLVSALENGLPDVETQGDCSKSKNFGATKGKGGKGKLKNRSEA